ncbi:C6 zinc finger domain-containing protein [Coccidioides immitis RS]|uniref:C6 zinc finger domain-containing protein n=3 Tax=Coccidioides immitis TaxID=5501 RepID=J3KI83_COCIM|nr:C6 zinc finger domain-containing protein [Coccidioides immitis RS]EAS35656.3 C6 zinc finger domain-containing protein [Coccidioides immitis RS]KMP00922.1 transcription factor [Coccidioides immitis RMSCC 2394]TPX26121.1 Transcriptional regulator of nonfermentable carbon utilization [Coccidioides immitis]
MTTNAINGPVLPTPLATPGDNNKPADTTMADQGTRPESQPQGQNNGAKPQNGQTKPMSAANAKDPLRPRRKKAKRACFACQRAHLTCGDERPCQRCIKRGIQNACHDGVRKKAKYLHDAPNEALMPHLQGHLYTTQANTARHTMPLTRNGSNSKTNFYPQQQSSFNNFYQNKPDPTLNQPQVHDTGRPDTFPSQSPVSPTFNMTANPAASGNQGLPSSLSASNSNASGQAQNGFGSAFFDPSDPALFNFDLASMNFGNHYGALEFGMLGHMATGAGETPPSDGATQHGSVGRSGSGTYTAGSNFGESPTGQPSFLFGDPTIGGDWTSSVNTRNIYGQNMNNMSETPHAFAIESAPANFASPNSIESPLLTNTTTFDDNTAPTYANRANINSVPSQRQPVVSTPQLKHLQVGKRRQRNPSAIYDSVKEPYSYTTGFHSLTAFIQRRFAPQNTLRIAKALASIRPSFIATTKTLNRDDLIFMEKCFQRTLWEYEDFINACGTPTIVCRRTGEIAAVGKEFSILTGWKKEVLLGKEPNLNINTGGSSGAMSGVTSRGSFTPRTGMDVNPTGRTQPVFLAELLDDESVVEFYEDFAKLAFGDSRGSVMTTCKLLKYKTKADMDMLSGTTSSAGGENEHGAAGNGDVKPENGMGASNGQSQHSLQRQRKWSRGGIAGEAGMNQLGFKDGKVECSYCWTVKRDVFDIPMLIVMNFLPCI